MLWTLIGTWFRYLLVVAVNKIASNPDILPWVGPDTIAYLKEESTITWLVSGLITLLTILWASKSKVFDALETLKGIARPRTTTVAEVKAEVKSEANTVAGVAIPTQEQVREVFQTPIAVITRENGKG